MARIEVSIEEWNDKMKRINELEEDNVRLRKERDEEKDINEELRLSISLIKDIPFFDRVFNFKEIISKYLNEDYE